MKWRIITGLLICCVLLSVAVVIGYPLFRLYKVPLIDKRHAPVLLRLPKATSALSFAHQLKSRHLIPSEQAFLSLIKIQGVSQQLKAGIYEIQPGESAAQLLHRVVLGEVLTFFFQIIPGTTEAVVSARLEKAPYLTYHATDWLLIGLGYPSAEGLLLADTYIYEAGASSKEVLSNAHKHLQQTLENYWVNRAPGLPYQTAYEMLIAASILEKEASIPQEKRLISGVIVNRLRKNMPLQMDPTVIYALGVHYQGVLTRDDLQIESPYNTYRHRGLPPTPITMVGKEAIDAAAHPEPTDYLYFVATGEGRHHFSVNYDDQKKAISRYLGSRK